MNDPFYTIDEIPDPEKNPEFWSTIQSPHFKSSINFLIINEIRKYSPETMSSASCRTQLAKLKAWQELLDLPKGLLNQEDKEGSPSDEIPE